MTYLPTLVLLTLFSFGCSSSKIQKKSKLEVVSAESGEIAMSGPKWLSSPNAGCSKREICAVGEGSSFSDSDVNSKAALASIFQTHVQSEFKSSTESFTQSELYEMKESVSEVVTEQVDQAIQAVVIKTRHQTKSLFYSLASMNKSKVSKILKEKISNLDDELSGLLLEKKRLLLPRMNILYNQRELINEKLTILRGMGVPKKISLKDIQNLKFQKLTHKRLQLVAVQTPEVIIKNFQTILSELGFIFIDKKADYLIHTDFKTAEAYLKVSGFKKFEYILNFTATNSDGESVGNFVVEHSQTGRNARQSMLKAMPQILEKMKEKIEKLNL